MQRVIKNVKRLEQHTLSCFHELKMSWTEGKENNSTLPPASTRGSSDDNLHYLVHSKDFVKEIGLLLY